MRGYVSADRYFCGYPQFSWIRIVISLLERIRIRILCHGYSTDMHYALMLFCLNLILCIVYIRRHTGHRHKMQLQVIELSKCTYCVLQASLVTCRILAGWPLRNPVTAPRSSRHQSENRPIFFARSRSSLVLKPLTVFAITESLSSIFHLDTTR